MNYPEWHDKKIKQVSSQRIKKGLSLSKPFLAFLPANLVLIQRNILYSITEGFESKGICCRPGLGSSARKGPGMFVIIGTVQVSFKLQINSEAGN